MDRDCRAADIVKLAREYATVHPAVIRVNYGVQRSEGGGMATRAITMLPCVTGSWKEVGGGLQLSTSGAYGLNREALERKDLMGKALRASSTRVINMVELGRALNTLDDPPPIKALFVYSSNPAAVCPNHNEVVRGLRRPDLFTVVHEQFFTDTTDYADIVLPATTFFEHERPADRLRALLSADCPTRPSIRLGECRSNVETFPRRWPSAWASRTNASATRPGNHDRCRARLGESLARKELTEKRLDREGQVHAEFRKLQIS
jgi:anaerobic selenocysteine-containing dehydrogenase